MAPTASSRRSPHDPAKPKAPSREDTNPTSLQAFALAKLLVDPSKQVFIPAPPKGNGIKTLRAPSDMMKNVQGSSAGAGSGTGEFHVYRAGRRREYERLALMDEQEKLDAKIAGTAARALEYETTAEAKTAKNRLKRQRQKNNSRGVKPGASSSAASTSDIGGGGDGEKKRKIGSGPGVKFTRPEDREDDEDEEEDDVAADVGSTSLSNVREEEEEKEAVVAAVEAGILIRDED